MASILICWHMVLIIWYAVRQTQGFQMLESILEVWILQNKKKNHIWALLLGKLKAAVLRVFDSRTLCSVLCSECQHLFIGVELIIKNTRRAGLYKCSGGVHTQTRGQTHVRSPVPFSQSFPTLFKTTNCSKQENSNSCHCALLLFITEKGGSSSQYNNISLIKAFVHREENSVQVRQDVCSRWHHW